VQRFYWVGIVVECEDKNPAWGRVVALETKLWNGGGNKPY